MTTTQSKISIDLVPYNVDINYKQATIKDCVGSILGKLNNNPEVTGFNSTEHQYTELVEGLWVKVSVKDNNVTFDRVKGRKRININCIVNWIYDYFDCIESIGCETLKTKIG